MKKSITISVVLSILFVAFTQLANAQVSYTLNGSGAPANMPAEKAIYTVPSGQFVPVATAILRLEQATKVLKETLSQHTEGSPAYISAFRRYTYYNGILSLLGNGKGVAEAITQAIGTIMGDAAAPYSATAEEALVERNAAITMLRP